MADAPDHSSSATPRLAHGTSITDSSPYDDAEKGNVNHEASSTTTGGEPEYTEKRRCLEEDALINKQIDSEAGNAIKYRTCSWKKVRVESTNKRS